MVDELLAARGIIVSHEILRQSYVFPINTLAPYILTTLISRPGRLVYVSSELHRRGDASLQDLTWERRPW